MASIKYTISLDMSTCTESEQKLGHIKFGSSGISKHMPCLEKYGL